MRELTRSLSVDELDARCLTRALSTREVLARYLIGKRKLNDMIRRGLLTAIDVGGAGRRQLRFTPEALREFEERLAVRPQARRRKPGAAIDPDIVALLDD